MQVTVVGKQSGRELRPYRVTETGHDLLILHPGLRKPEEVFQQEHNQNRMDTLVNRGGGWFCLFLAFNCAAAVMDAIGQRQTISHKLKNKHHLKKNPKYGGGETKSLPKSSKLTVDLSQWPYLAN